jgi:hypothetical protein
MLYLVPVPDPNLINYGSGSDFLTSYGSDSGSCSTSQKVTVPTVPAPQHCFEEETDKICRAWFAFWWRLQQIG